MEQLPLVLSCLLALSGSIAAAAELEVHFVDVGQGECRLISCPNGNRILIDCGSPFNGTNPNATQYVRDRLDGHLDDLGYHPSRGFTGRQRAGHSPERKVRNACHFCL